MLKTSTGWLYIKFTNSFISLNTKSLILAKFSLSDNESFFLVKVPLIVKVIIIVCLYFLSLYFPFFIYKSYSPKLYVVLFRSDNQCRGLNSLAKMVNKVLSLL